jgi:hypothetical protein
VVYTDHKNLTFERFSSDRVTRWRLYTEEFTPKFVYLPDKDNVVANALSRLPMMESNDAPETAMEELFEIAGLNDDDLNCPIDLSVISKLQLTEFTNKQRKHMHKMAFGPIPCWLTTGITFVCRVPCIRRLSVGIMKCYAILVSTVWRRLSPSILHGLHFAPMSSNIRRLAINVSV